MKVVKAAAVQISPALYSREATVEKVAQKMHKLGQLGVQFATFPETVMPATRTFPQSRRASIEQPEMLDAG
jgi:predicted amidohydrolase